MNTRPRSSYRDMTGPYGHLAERTAFAGNSMSAEWTDQKPYAGRLSTKESLDALRNTFDAARLIGAQVYVVYSYSTPIAFAIGSEEAFIVDEKFSVTTSKGQGYVRAWIDEYAKGQGYAAYLAERERLGI